jgi:hypothetical protein
VWFNISRQTITFRQIRVIRLFTGGKIGKISWQTNFQFPTCQETRIMRNNLCSVLPTLRLSAILAVLASGLAGCASDSAFQQTTQQWIGRNADQLAATFGEPTASNPAGNGSRVMQFDKSRKSCTPYQDPTVQIEGETRKLVSCVREQCSVRFTVDSHNVVVASSASGGGCTALFAKL